MRNAVKLAFALCCVLLAFGAHCEAQAAGKTQIVELCGTSNMQSVAGSGSSSGEGARFSSIRCVPSQSGYVVQIFNGAEAIDCSGSLNPPVSDSLQFAVAMSCTGPENGGFGVTGSIKIPQNTTTQTFSSVVNIPYGLTSDDVTVLLDNQNLNIAGRTCTLTLLADLRAKDPVTQECVNCLAATVVSVVDTCGSIDTSTDCSFFHLVCHFDQGTWYKSAFFWFLFDLLIMVLVPIFAYAIILNDRRNAERRLFHRALAADLRANAARSKRRMMSSAVDAHAKRFDHGGSKAIREQAGEPARRLGRGAYASSSNSSVRSGRARRRGTGFDYVAVN